MSTNKNDPAFPAEESHATDGTQQIKKHLGITRREYFAAMAMQGLLANAATAGSATEIAPLASAVAVHMADQLINELGKERT